MNSQRGFSFVPVLIAIILLLAGGSGWLLYKKRTDEKPVPAPVSTATQKTEATTPPAGETDATKDWVKYTSTSGYYSLKYPKTWVTAIHPDLCNEGVLLLGPDAKSVGACASENAGQVIFSSSSTSDDACSDMSELNHSGITKQSVTLNGVTASRQAGTVKYNGEGIGAPEGTKEIEYCAEAKGHVYRATYNQRPTFADVANDFEAIVTKTWQFLD